MFPAGSLKMLIKGHAHLSPPNPGGNKVGLGLDCEIKAQILKHVCG